MTEFSAIVNEYYRDAEPDDMERLTKIVDCLFADVKETDPELYHKYIVKIKLANKCIPWDKDQAEYAVEKMKNKDGTTGEHWSYDKTTDVLKNNDLDFNPAAWYYVLNMVYSDHYSESFDTSVYVKLAADILNDVDAPKNVTKKTFVAKHY